MSGSLMETRALEVMSAAITKSAGGALTVGPFARDAIVVRLGSVVTTLTADNEVAVTTSPDVGSFAIPIGEAAGDVRVIPALADPTPADGSPAGQYVLPKGTTLTVTGAVAAGAGVYHLFAEVIKKALVVDGDTVNEG